MVAFSDVLTDVTGGNEKTKQSDYETAGSYPIVDQGQALIGGYTNDHTRLCKTAAPVIVFGDHTKALKFVDFPFCLGADGTKVLTASENADARYLFYALHNVHIPDAGYSRHFKYLKAGEIPLPPLEEQKRIAGILDQADALRRLRTRALDKLGNLGQAIFHEMFGDWRVDARNWPIVELGDQLDFLTSGSRGWAKYYTKQGAKFIRIQNVKRDVFDLTDMAYVSAPDSAEAKRTKVRAGDVLMSITADLGRTAVVPDNIGDAHINQHLAILRLKDMHPRFVSAALSSQAGQAEVLKKNREGVKAGLNFEDVRSVLLPFPPMEMQLRYCERLDLVASSVSNVNVALREQNALFNSLQHRAFRGEL